MFLGSSRRIYIDISLLEEATSKSTSIGYNLYIIRKEGCNCKGRTKGYKGDSILVSFIVRFKLHIYLARFC